MEGLWRPWRSLLSLLLAVEAQGTWYPIDASVVLCRNPKTPQAISVTIPGPGYRAFHTPHILSFYRQTNQSVAIKFGAVDARNIPVIQTTTVELQEFSRRLQEIRTPRAAQGEPRPEGPEDGREEQGDWELASQEHEEVDADVDARPWHLDETEAEADADLEGEEVEVEVEVEDHAEGTEAEADAETKEDDEDDEDLEGGEESAERSAPARQLAGRRRGGGGSRFGGSSRSRSSFSSSSSRQTDVRRRANPTAARRRGSNAPGTQPTAGVGGSRFQNQNGQAYAYSSPTAMSSNFGGRPPMTTGYGYSGASAYRPGYSGGSVAAAVVGGAVVGAGLTYMYYSWSRMNSYCSYGNSYSGSCSECYSRYSSSMCTMRRPLYNMNRDDMMRSGFWPADFTGPITVTIYEVIGADFSQSSVCPPPNWNINWTNVSAGPIGLYMTLTEVAELGDDLQQDSSPNILSVILSTLASILCCCAFLGAGALILYKMKRSQQVEFQTQPYSPDGMHPAHGQPYVAGQPQPGFFQQGFPAQGGSFQPGAGSVPMGAVVMGQPMSSVGGPQGPPGYTPGKY